METVKMDRERNLLFALFAARLGVADAAAVRGALAAWEADPGVGIPRRMVGSGAIAQETGRFLVGTVHRVVMEHGNDLTRALDAFGGEARVQAVLQGVPDAPNPPAAAKAPVRAVHGVPLAWGLVFAALAFLAMTGLTVAWIASIQAETLARAEASDLAGQLEMLTSRAGHFEQERDLLDHELTNVKKMLEQARQERAQAQAALRAMKEPPVVIPPPNLSQEPQSNAPGRPMQFERGALEKQFDQIDPATALLQLAPTFATDAQGRPIGVTSFNFSRFPLAQQFGLQDGDIISTVNGVPITSLDSLVQIGAAIEGASRVSATIIRNGQPIQVSIGIR